MGIDYFNPRSGSTQQPSSPNPPMAVPPICLPDHLVALHINWNIFGGGLVDPDPSAYDEDATGHCIFGFCGEGLSVGIVFDAEYFILDLGGYVIDFLFIDC